MSTELQTARKIIEAVDQPTWVVGPLGDIGLINSAAITTLGYRVDDEVLGLNSHQTLHHSHPDGTTYNEAECPLLNPHASARVGVEWLIRRDGSLLPVKWATRVVELDGVGMVMLTISGLSASRSSPEGPGADRPNRIFASTTRADLFRRATSYLRAHALDPDVSPGSAARAHNVSIRLLQSAFADNGESPARFLRRCRLERAAQLLVEGQSTRESCVLAGFSDESTYRRAFRDYFGKSPAAYRETVGSTMLDTSKAQPCNEDHGAVDAT